MFWNRISTDRKLELIQQDLELLKREFRQVQQEWDATAERVAKTLRRIKRTEQSKLAAEEVEEHGDQTTLPLTTIPPGGERLARIRQQLAEKGKVT